MLYPTIYHKDIEIVDAYIEKHFYSESRSFMNSEKLYIKEKYTGVDNYLKDFYKNIYF
jgi:hypothetical protein